METGCSCCETAARGATCVGTRRVDDHGMPAHTGDRVPPAHPPNGAPGTRFEAAVSTRAFLEAPGNRYIAGGSWLVFHLRDDVAGLVMWGAPTVIDLQPLFEIFRAFDSPLGRPLPRYFDIRRLTNAEQAVITDLMHFVGQHVVELGRVFTAIACVHQGGVGQAITEGIRLLAQLDFHWAGFGSGAAALEWLGRSDAAAIDAELESLIAFATGGVLVLHDVRAYCAARLATARIGDCARSLNTSTRSLQRRLGEHGTSFQRVLNEERIQRAKHSLTSSDRSIADVAREVGVDARYFATVFRRLVGCSPLAWRAKTRSQT